MRPTFVESGKTTTIKELYYIPRSTFRKAINERTYSIVIKRIYVNDNVVIVLCMLYIK